MLDKCGKGTRYRKKFESAPVPESESRPGGETKVPCRTRNLHLAADPSHFYLYTSEYSLLRLFQYELI